MRRQVTRLAAIGLLLAGGTIGQAQEVVDPPPVMAPAPHTCHQASHRGFSLSRLWSWMTYHPQPVPKSCECRMLELTPTPPLYTYFLGEYGPRSPGLGYPVWDHGLAFSSPEHCGH